MLRSCRRSSDSPFNIIIQYGIQSIPHFCYSPYSSAKERPEYLILSGVSESLSRESKCISSNTLHVIDGQVVHIGRLQWMVVLLLDGVDGVLLVLHVRSKRSRKRKIDTKKIRSKNIL
jgi:hypothetical protein